MAVTMEKLYKEVKSLKDEVETMRFALMPEVKISKKEKAELNKIEKEMASGKKMSFNEVFA
jgi:hypothetical protein